MRIDSNKKFYLAKEIAQLSPPLEGSKKPKFPQGDQTRQYSEKKYLFTEDFMEYMLKPSEEEDYDKESLPTVIIVESCKLG